LTYRVGRSAIRCAFAPTIDFFVSADANGQTRIVFACRAHNPAITAAIGVEVTSSDDRPFYGNSLMLPDAHPSTPDGSLPIEPKDHIEGLARGLSVIESFDSKHARMTSTEVGARTGLPRTAARRYLLTLCHYGYAKTDGKLFWLTPRVLRLGESFLDAAGLPRLVQSAIEHLSVRSGETINVSVLDGHEVVYVARSNSPRFVSIGFFPGLRAPAHVVTAGVTLLAAMDESRIRQWVDEHEFTAFTAKTVTDKAVFLETVRAARHQGYSILQEQMDTGLQGVSMVLRDRRGTAVAALGMTLHVESWPRDRIVTQLVPAMSETAQTLRPML
jgi:IclR family transcriptional regulator, pca regulon regulatory protein